jgi:glyoxylase-like metal-dependent hydrolase (beta-lactamase superfamily II)
MQVAYGRWDSTLARRSIAAALARPAGFPHGTRFKEFVVMSAHPGKLLRRCRHVAPLVLAGLLLAPAGPLQAEKAPRAAALELSLTRLDCGDLYIKNYSATFSDTFRYPAVSKRLVDSCYLIRNGDRLLLWDAGLPDSLIGRTYDTPMQSLTLRRTLLDQLAEIGVSPGQIEALGVSHWHFDHVGQAPHFQSARLLIGKKDAEALRSSPTADADSRDALKHWLDGHGKIELVSGDKDVFGDGRVIMLDTPGHTDGHHALLVRLESGPVLLSGDLYHFSEQVPNRGVPGFNLNRADTLASMSRFEEIAANLGARIIIQHEPADVGKLPAFPLPAR